MVICCDRHRTLSYLPGHQSFPQGSSRLMKGAFVIVASTPVEFTLRWPAWLTCPPMNQFICLSNEVFQLARYESCIHLPVFRGESPLIHGLRIGTAWLPKRSLPTSPNQQGTLPEFPHVMMLSFSQSLVLCFINHLIKILHYGLFVFIWFLFFLRRKIPVNSWRSVQYFIFGWWPKLYIILSCWWCWIQYLRNK